MFSDDSSDHNFIETKQDTPDEMRITIYLYIFSCTHWHTWKNIFTEIIGHNQNICKKEYFNHHGFLNKNYSKIFDPSEYFVSNYILHLIYRVIQNRHHSFQEGIRAYAPGEHKKKKLIFETL